MSPKFHPSPFPALICSGKLVPALPQSTSSPSSGFTEGEGGGIGRKLEGGRRGKLGYFSCFCGSGRGCTSLRPQTLPMDALPRQQRSLASRDVASSLVIQMIPGRDFPLLRVPGVLQRPRGSPSPACTSEDNARQRFVRLSTLGAPSGPTWTPPDSGEPTSPGGDGQEADELQDPREPDD